MVIDYVCFIHIVSVLCNSLNAFSLHTSQFSIKVLYLFFFLSLVSLAFLSYPLPVFLYHHLSILLLSTLPLPSLP